MYGYYEYPDVITLPDAERMLSAHQFVRPSTGEAPRNVAFIQCVGSRDRRLGNEYCSKVCCGVASKEAIEIRRLLPGCKVYIFYIDMRMYGYWENEIYWPAQEQYNVNYIRGIVTEITSRDGRLLMKGEDTTMGRPLEVLMDVIVLSVGMEPSRGTREVAALLGIDQNKYGFIATPGEPMDPVGTSVPGIFVAGAAAGPKDLEDSMSMAGAAAMRAIGAIRGRAAVGAAASR
jgi:heterodisulfide reductase subunit A